MGGYKNFDKILLNFNVYWHSAESVLIYVYRKRAHMFGQNYEFYRVYVSLCLFVLTSQHFFSHTETII